MFKRRSGLGGVRVVIGPMRRDDPATGGAGGADATAGGGGAPAAAPPAAAPAAAAAPAVVVPDVTQTKEYKDAVAKVTADIEAKARAGTKANAQKEIFDQLAVALGQKPAEIDPAAIGAELATARSEIVSLKTQIAVGSAARNNGGDEDMVTAWLMHKGKLTGLDPAAADFSTKVADIVKAEIEGNPKLKSATVAPPVTPGNSGAGSTAMAGGAGGNARTLGLGNALAAAMRK